MFFFTWKAVLKSGKRDLGVYLPRRARRGLEADDHRRLDAVRVRLRLRGEVDPRVLHLRRVPPTPGNQGD